MDYLLSLKWRLAGLNISNLFPSRTVFLVLPFYLVLIPNGTRPFLSQTPLTLMNLEDL